MKKFLIVFAVFLEVCFGSSIKIAAAANTTYAFNELQESFEKLYPNIKLEISLGSSGALSTQIRNGAPFDIFMAANMKFAKDLFKDGFAKEDAVLYAKGKLAMFSIRDFDLKKGLEVLKDVKTITIANPKTAPYGEASVEAFKKAKIYDEIKDKIIEAKSISEALSQSLSASDIGFIAASSVYAPKMKEYKEGKNYVFVDPKLYTPIDQGMVLLKSANADAKIFYDFILSSTAKDIFKKYGYDF